MKEYQKAYDMAAYFSMFLTVDMHEGMKKYLLKLKELVDRATPMKPIENATEGEKSEFECGFCGTYINEPFKKDFCSDCGQAIDWSDYA